MDKSDFIRLAPAYYEAAVIFAFKDEHGFIPEFRLRSKYHERHPDSSDPEDGFSLVGDEELLQLAMQNLVRKNVVVALRDPFGPSQFKEGDGLNAYMDEARADTNSPIYKGEASGDADQWLRLALNKLSDIGNDLRISPKDWERPDRDWEPIPLDRDEPILKEAIASLDETIAEIEQSNGYASEHPEERNYVVDNLKLLSNKLKSAASTSAAYVRSHGLNVLQKVADKFSGAAMGEAAKATLKALGEWLHHVLPNLF